MTWLFAFGWIPVPVFYIPRLFAGGFTPLVCILIKTKYRDDVGLHQHELLHAEQAYRLGLLLHALLYIFHAPYRQWAEVNAYRRQIACYAHGASIDFAVEALAHKYWLQITEAEARNLLTQTDMKEHE